MTAHAMQGDRERCLAAGMDGTVSKPIKLDDRDTVMQLVLEGRPAAFTPQQERSFDLAGALEMVNGETNLLEEVATVLCRDWPGWVDELRAAIGGGDARWIERAAHSLKEAVSVFGMTAAQNLAHELETLSQAIDLAGAATIFPMLERLSKAFADSGLTTTR